MAKKAGGSRKVGRMKNSPSHQRYNAGRTDLTHKANRVARFIRKHGTHTPVPAELAGRIKALHGIQLAHSD